MNNVFIIQGQEEMAAGIRYEVDCSVPPIGEGGMGRVYRGLQINERTGVRRPAAVKFLYGDLPLSMIDRVKREASIQLHNDNLVEMFGLVTVDVTEANGQITKRLHVVSELLEGVMLHDLLQGAVVDVYGQEVAFGKEMLALMEQDRTMFALKIVKHILSGIMALHDAGYIHRDIDPSNIMLTSDRKVKLIDFGIARKFGSLANDRPLTSDGTFIGKAEYAAPELVLGDVNHQNETTDIYAVGILLFQLATGHKPFTGPTNEVLAKQRNEPLPLNEIQHPGLRTIIQRATEKIQSQRYQSAAEFRVDLDRLERSFKQQAEGGATHVDPYANTTRQDGSGEMPYTRSQEIPAEGTQIVGEMTASMPEPQDMPADTQDAGTMIVENPASGKSAPSSTAATVPTAPKSPLQTYLPWIAAAVGGLAIGAIAGIIF